MKFKAVEIQAFRAYDKSEDGTFNFETSNGTNADFVSLYAPNGFGKTSFYDAVEYGITNNIHRFIRRQDFSEEYSQSQKNINSSDRQFILRNTFSDPLLPGYIKLSTTDSIKPIHRVIPSPRKGGRDLKLNDKETENRYFKEVILSQEWIDAFLKEDSATGRYTTFMEYFGDKSLDEYYRILSDLITLNDKRIDAIKKDLHGIQRELNFEGDKEILSKINEKIIALNENGEKLQKIEESFNDTDNLNLTNAISERKSDIDFEKNKNEELISFINLTFTGDENVRSINAYFEAKDAYLKLKTREDEVKLANEKISLKNKLSNQLESLIKGLSVLVSRKDLLDNIKKEWPAYENLRENINSKLKEIAESAEPKSDLEKSLSSLRIDEKEFTTRITHLQNQVTSLEKLLKEFPLLNEDFSKSNGELEQFHNNLKPIDPKISDIEKEIGLIEATIKRLTEALKNISSLNSYPPVYEKEFIKYELQIKELEKLSSDLKAENSKLEEVKERIKNQQGYQKEIEQFVTRGLEIVNRTQADTCPLCSHQYESYIILAENISNNTALSDQLSNLVKERTDIENSIHKINQIIKDEQDKLRNDIEKDLEAKNTNLGNLKTDLSKLKDDKSSILKNIELLVEKTNVFKISLNNLTAEAYERSKREELERQKHELEEATKKLGGIQSKLKEDALNLDLLTRKITGLEQEKSTIEGDSIYIKIINFFKEHFADKEIKVSLIDIEIESLVNKISENANDQSKRKAELEDVNKVLSAFDETSLPDLLSQVVQDKEAIQRTILSFEQTISSKTNINAQEYNLQQLTELLQSRRKDAELQTEKVSLLIKELDLVLALKENVIPFLKYEKAKSEEKSSKDRLNFLKDSVGAKLINEKTRLSSHIDEQITSFFYEGLINDLYRRIDPHPEYKKIKFKCDFTDDKPKLNVCVYQDNEDELIIPNLYFSTAQLNILSLSIFLAKALNAKDEKDKPLECIFIDDPIQSMDSINILSTIDLLRSIVVNQEKQIILSTHDENFHNLLKKKMPPGPFKSKFMELETFGKVKLRDI